MQSRRSFLKTAAAVSTGFAGLSQFCSAKTETTRFGELIPDPKGIIDLPRGFSYRVISRTGDRMDDGMLVSGKPDGMAAFDSPDGRSTILIRNHELALGMDDQGGPFEKVSRLPDGFDHDLCYDSGVDGKKPHFGGTSTVIYDCEKQKVTNQFQSLLGTDRNCAGGPTPWGTWITCEETEKKAMVTPRFQGKHGYCFEVSPTLEPELQTPQPIRGMGRFRHEAVAVDPETGIVYETEDDQDGLLYRYIPNQPGNLLAGGKLEALVIPNLRGIHTKRDFPLNRRLKVEWVEMDDVDSPDDDMRDRGNAKGAARFARGEGMWYGHDAIYFACTSGGDNQRGQIWRYFPKTEVLELFLEPNDTELLEYADNLTIAPWGDLVLCEDSKANNRVLGVTPQGEIYRIGLNSLNKSEFAGACFAPNHPTMFVNIQNPGITLAVTGPWGD